jgi:hypothetical protein
LTYSEYVKEEAVSRADGDVIVFSDTSTRIPLEGLKEIMANFADPSVSNRKNNEQ